MDLNRSKDFWHSFDHFLRAFFLIRLSIGALTLHHLLVKSALVVYCAEIGPDLLDILRGWHLEDGFCLRWIRRDANIVHDVPKKFDLGHGKMALL